MKKQIALATLACLSLSVLMPALADDAWFNKYGGHKGEWDYNSFTRAQRAWEIKHHEKRLSKEELRARFNELDHEHHGRLHADDVRNFHEW